MVIAYGRCYYISQKCIPNDMASAISSSNSASLKTHNLKYKKIDIYHHLSILKNGCVSPH